MNWELPKVMNWVLPKVMNWELRKVAVMLSNMVAQTLQPSFYDSIIQIKKLPYLPEFVNKANVNAHRIFVEDIMVKDVVVVTSINTLEEITQLLHTHNFKTFPLVDAAETNILLGSIERMELQRLISNTLTRENKLTYFRNRQKERLQQRMTGMPSSPASQRQEPPAEGSLQVPTIERLQQPMTGSPGRFAVYMVDEANAQEEEAEIWKREHLKDHSGEADPSKPRSILKKSPSGIDLEHRAKVHFTAETPIKEGDITPEMESAWIDYQLRQPVQFEKCNIDPAPFQLVERTSLYKVHSLFSLLSLHHAYVTNMGRLVGIISLKEVRAAIQGEVSATRVFSTKKITQENIEREQRKIDMDATDNDTSPDASAEDGRNSSDV
ncbi:Chloride channel protein 2 [Lamellibrachia satsuma]|nr:Chloride channel protein 2 [Lamellibrachia satsuma]